ncbi:MAG TPA: DUF3592 domain-containing protein [Pyrinomonadaceae bacterium]|jgi:hypothetical protein
MEYHIGAGACLLIGSATLLYAAKRIIETVVFLRAATAAAGTVVELAAARDGDGHPTYLPIFEYETRDGRRFRHVLTVASTPPAYRIGETATILYLRKNPQNARLKLFSELWLATLVIAVIGVAFCGAGLVIVIARQ